MTKGFVTLTAILCKIYLILDSKCTHNACKQVCKVSNIFSSANQFLMCGKATGQKLWLPFIVNMLAHALCKKQKEERLV